MPKRFFDYLGISTIEIDAPNGLLRRICDNIEGQVKNQRIPDCKIKIRPAETSLEIEKDKRFEYARVERLGNGKYPTLKYYRYNTLIRTIHQTARNSYEVETNTHLDESSALICIRDYLRNHPKLVKYPLIHASLINLEGKGTLLAGNSKQGKTTLMTYLLQEREGLFVGDENLYLDICDEMMTGMYIPKTVRVRFSTIAKSNLAEALKNLKVTNATQYLDSDFIDETIMKHNFEVEWGLAFSRGAFCRLLGANSQTSSRIQTILFPVYNPNEKVNVRKITFKEGIRRLASYGLIKKSSIDPKELQGKNLDLNEVRDKELDFLEITFSGITSLLKGGLRL